MEQPSDNAELSRVAQVPIQGAVKEQIEAILEKMINSKGQAGKFSYPQEYDKRQTALDFSTLRNLVLLGYVQSIQHLLQLIRELLDQFRGAKDRSLASVVPDVEKQVIKELRKIPGLQAIYYQNYREICDMERLEPLPVAEIVPDDCWRIVSQASQDGALQDRLLATAKEYQGEQVVRFSNEQTQELVRLAK